MIEKLYIRNYAIIQELEISFSDKLTIITGETGAGKSILLGAIGLITGSRADSKVLYEKDSKCVIEGTFETSQYNLKSFFEINDIDYDEQVIIRRELTPSGKSRAFINDTPVNLSTLKDLASTLVDIHHQFDSLDIHNVSFQTRTLDALAGNQKLMLSYQEKFSTYKRKRKELDEMILKHQNASKELDFLSFQLEEFKEVNLSQNEQTELEQEQKTLSAAEQIKSSFSKANHIISESDNSILEKIKEVGNELGDLKDLNPNINLLWERLHGSIAELEDLSAEFQNQADVTEYDENRIEEISERLDLIYRLQNKHHVGTLEELLSIQSELEEKINSFADMSSQIESLESEIEKKRSELSATAEELSAKRKKIVKGFEAKVHGLLAQLSMEHAQIKVDIQILPELSLTGIDDVHFLFAPNKGSTFELIKNVASGGELSRLTLCIKSLVASAIPLPTLIFDEIDSGVSGDVALKMGNILNKLADDHQVVTITHTPQIAAKADRHYFVYKKVQKNRTITHVKELNREERIVEIATMLSGNPPSDSAVENAQDLLKR